MGSLILLQKLTQRLSQMKTLKNSLTLFLLFAVFNSNAQDLIYKKNREILKVKVIEITSDEIKFKDFDNPNYPLFSIEKAKVSKLELEGGDVIEFKIDDTFNDPDYYTGQAKNALKVSFTGFFFNQATFYYERSITPSTSFEGGLSFIGGGFDNLEEENAKGFGLRLGYKLKRSPSYHLNKMRYAHLLNGGYIKPEIIISVYSEENQEYDHLINDYTSTRSSTNIVGAFMINFGNQGVYNDQFLIESYFGIGMGFSDSGEVHYGFVGGGEIPLAITAGLNIGLIFKDKKDRIKQ